VLESGLRTIAYGGVGFWGTDGRRTVLEYEYRTVTPGEGFLFFFFSFLELISDLIDPEPHFTLTSRVLFRKKVFIIW